MITVAGGGELGEHPAQGGLAEPAYGPRGEPEPVVAAGQVALLLELALQVAQGGEVADRLGAEALLQQVHVDIVEGRADLTLGQLGLQRLQVGQVGHGLHGLAVAERLTARTHPGRRIAIQTGPQRPQVVPELGHLRGQVGVAQGLAHQLGQLLALFGAERVEHPLRGGLLPGERVDQLLDGLGLLREELAVLVHEVLERIGGVLVAGVRGQQRVQVGQHVLDPLHRLRIRRLQGLLQSGELRVQDLPAQHVLDRLVRGPGLVGAPLIGIQGADRPGHVVGNGVQLQFGEPGVVAVGAGQGLPLGGEGLVQRGADLVEGAPEIAAAAGLGPQLRDLGGQPVQPALAVQPAAQQVPQRVPQVAGGQQVGPDLIHRGPHVVRRGQRVRAAAPGAVPVAARAPTVIIVRDMLGGHRGAYIPP